MDQSGNSRQLFPPCRRIKSTGCPLSVGAIRPTQGKTLAVLQVEAGSQSFNTVNNLRVLGRWMRMVVIPNQVSIPQAYKEFEEEEEEADGDDNCNNSNSGNDDMAGNGSQLKDSPFKRRLVDVVDELFKYTLLLRDQQPYLLQRYAKRSRERNKT